MEELKIGKSKIKSRYTFYFYFSLSKRLITSNYNQDLRLIFLFKNITPYQGFATSHHENIGLSLGTKYVFSVFLYLDFDTIPGQW